MSKTLILMRHAKAIADDIIPQDHYRPLTEDGLIDASHAAHALKASGFIPSHAFVSTATRTQETFAQVHSVTPIANVAYEEKLYMASARQILNIIHTALNSCETLLIIGHNPGLAELANHIIHPLQHEEFRGKKFTPATIAVFKWPYDKWEGQTPTHNCRLLEWIEG